jgi:hypothetical protein
MSKIFGYSNRGGQDWFVSDSYSDREIESIPDPEGGGRISHPTAIPSPFARIDIMKTAFRNISKSPNLKAYTKSGSVIAGINDEKLVSDCLDLTEMLFNIDSLKDKIRIIVWDKEADLSKLKTNSEMHRRLAETLELYLEQDKEAYNFDLVRRLYLIEYNHKIIGCTSPATLFFPTANTQDLGRVRESFSGNRKTFETPYACLHDRDDDFQNYLHGLFRFNPKLQTRLTAFYDYLNKSLTLLEEKNPKLFSDIKKITKDEFDRKYIGLDTLKGNNDIIEVIGIELKKRKKENLIQQVEHSDFLITSSKNPNSLRPLVLQNDFTRAGFKYIGDDWNSTTKVPYFNAETVLEKRKLPDIGFEYPYLTYSDFLEPYLIRLVYPINKEKFFDGNIVTEVGDDLKGYILPLKKQFFDYFFAADLLSTSPDKPTINLIQGIENSVRVVLSIPIKKDGEHISLERIYLNSPRDNQLLKQDESLNRGIIVEQQVGISIYPWIKTNNPELGAYYRIQVVDRNNAGIFKDTDYNLQFYSDDKENPVSVKNEESIGTGKPKKRSNKDSSDATTQYYVIENEFNYIQIKDVNKPDIKGVIIPKWPIYNGGRTEFRFALDFGTTNTHIEYKTTNVFAKAFDIANEDIQIATLFDSNRTSEDFGGTGAIAIREMIDYEFVPQTIGQHSNYEFPTRTVSAEGKNANIALQSSFALADYNIPFNYEKSHDQVNEIKSNLKWAKSDPVNKRRVEAYFETLFLLMRNKVLRCEGNIMKTELVWFYPSSMTKERREKLEALMNEYSKKYFIGKSNPIGLSESLAPYYYYKATNQMSAGGHTPVVSIDIGGGTTDVVVFKSNKPILLTSFKFAANSLFGDGFHEYGAKDNGLINKYLPYFEKLLTENQQYNLIQVLESIKGRNKSDDIVAFLFSLEKNHRIQDKRLFSFNKLLSEDEDLKIVYLYFYSSIIYYTAQLIKKELGVSPMPNYIVFSGTGSKILQIISPSDKTISELTQIIFEKVCNVKYVKESLQVKPEKEFPKELTCKGGLMVDTNDLEQDLRKIKKILTCLEDKGISDLKFNMLNDQNCEDITQYIKSFNNFFIELNTLFNFRDSFGVSDKSLAIFTRDIDKHLRDYLFDGVENLKKLDDIISDEEALDESLFFYPIIGSIKNLLSNLSDLSPLNQ